MQLNGNLLLDFQSSGDQFQGMSVDIKAYAERNKVSLYMAYRKTLEAMAKRLGNNRYNFITIDTTKQFEAICSYFAAYRYTQSAQGKEWKGTDAFQIPHGAGYGLVKEALTELSELLRPYVKYTIIWTGHVVSRASNKAGAAVDVEDLDLTGAATRAWFAGEMDAVGVMYPDPEDPQVRLLDFRKTSYNLISGSRPPHLNGKVIPVSRMMDDGITLKTRWDAIFPQLNKQ